MARDNVKARRIILELLHRPDGSLTKYRMAKETETNISWVIALLRKLEERKLVKETKVQDVDKLIDYYLTLEKKSIHFDFFIQEPREYFLSQKKTYLLTTYAAENNISYHLFLTRFDTYVKEEEIQVWKEELFKKGLLGKGNVRLIIPPDPYIFKFTQKIKGLCLVTIPLLLIDLKREGGVCMQAYEYLVKKYVS
ncbi:MAG: hypothetical protein AABX82_03970 [Nanoarchaeota archaeon]